MPGLDVTRTASPSADTTSGELTLALVVSFVIHLHGDESSVIHCNRHFL
jgi:hypothetical protein